MKLQFFTFILLISLTTNAIAQSSFTKIWDKRYGGFSSESLFSILHTNDGGYLLGGRSLSDSSGDKTQDSWHDTLQNLPTSDYWIVKTDSIGNKEWDKRFGGKQIDILISSQQLNGGNYFLIGASTSRNDGDKSQNNLDTAAIPYLSDDFWIVKIDSVGNKIWDKVYGGFNNDVPLASLITQDGNILIGGSSHSGISGDKTQQNWDTTYMTRDYWIIKIDTSGNKLWDRRFGGNKDDQLISLDSTSDGGYILGGWSASDSTGDKTQPAWTSGGCDYWMVKIDSQGNKMWDKRLGSIYNDLLEVVVQTKDQGYILGGYSWYYASGDKSQSSLGGTDYWVVKTDSLGVKEWDKVFGGNGGEDEFSSIIETCDGGYLLSGSSYSDSSGTKSENNLGLEQTWLVKIDSLGNKQWDKTILTPGHDEEGYLVKLTDNCFVVAQYYVGSGIGGYRTEANWDTSDTWSDFWFMQFCDTTLSVGCDFSSVNMNSQQTAVSIYPNPFTSEISVVVQKSNIGKATFSIQNVLGQTIFQKQENVFSSSFKSTIDLNILAKGIYILQVDLDEERVTRKIIKQ